MEKYNEIQLTKNKMDLNNRKITNHRPSPTCNLLYNGFKYSKTKKNEYI